jgi:ABC-type phosphate transport system substrate-binding protein
MPKTPRSVVNFLPSALALAALAFSGLALPTPPPGAYVVIVNPANGLASIDRAYLQDIFLKKITRWPDGEAVRPVDLAANSPVRDRFTEELLGRSVDAVKAYWQQRIFSGRDVPPPELDSSEEVVAYVLRHPEAVGYVARATKLSGAKILAVE